jgi:hypothetical protein
MKDALKGKTPWEDNICNPWIYSQETVFEQSGTLMCYSLLWIFKIKHILQRYLKNMLRSF